MGKLYNAVQYGISADTGAVDYDEVARLAKEHKPKLLLAVFPPTHNLRLAAIPRHRGFCRGLSFGGHGPRSGLGCGGGIP